MATDLHDVMNVVRIDRSENSSGMFMTDEVVSRSIVDTPWARKERRDVATAVEP